MLGNADFLLRLKPWSPTAFAIALLATVAASIVQEAAAPPGITLHFALFFLAIVVVGLLAGAPAGTCTAALAIPIVWWEFLPPQFEFSPLTGADYHRFAIFLLFSALAISACNLYRDALTIFFQFDDDERRHGRTRR
jgi:K+-sensing histidine kinase KdpD